MKSEKGKERAERNTDKKGEKKKYSNERRRTVAGICELRGSRR
jgi:hypothetical protein